MFLSRRSRDLWHSICPLALWFLGAINVMYSVMQHFRNLEDVFARKDDFPLAIGSRWFGPLRKVLWWVCQCRHCLGKVQGGCWLGLFNNDSYLSFRDNGILWRIWIWTVEFECDRSSCDHVRQAHLLPLDDQSYTNLKKISHSLNRTARGYEHITRPTNWSPICVSIWGACDARWLHRTHITARMDTFGLGRHLRWS